MANHSDFGSATSLQINEVTVEDLRCHEHLAWPCSAGMNLLQGANGSGKTTLLEAIYLMAHGRSFRQARDPYLVRKGGERFLIHGRWHRYGPMNLSVAGRRGQTSIRLQGRDIERRKDVSESFPVLVEAPQGRRLVDGSPGERRRWLDMLIMTCHQNMAAHYERYLRAMMQRSRLLRRRIVSNELDAWEQQIVHHGMQIVAAREHMLAEFNSLLADELSLTERILEMSINAAEYSETAWLDRLKSRRLDDMHAGKVRYGPHCDVLNLHYQQREIRQAGSRGQQKLAAIALKMAECALWARYRRLIPVLLLDDCLEALDSERQVRVLKRLQASPVQTLMTVPDGVNISTDVNIRISRLNPHGMLERGDTSFTNELTMEEAA